MALFETSHLFLSEATPKATSYDQNSSLKQYQPVKIIEKKYQWEIVWKNVIAFAYLHIAGLYGVYLYFFICSWKTFIYSK